LPVGTLVAGRIEWLQHLPADDQTQAKNLLVRGPAHSPVGEAGLAREGGGAA